MVHRLRRPPIGPPPEVLRAFGCQGPAVPLPGGEGRAWRAGGCVLKPVDDPERAGWACASLAALRPSKYRLADPLQASGGLYVFRGWTAASFQAGKTLNGRWDEKLAASRAFHADLKHVHLGAMPPSADRWSRAHAIAWRESPVPDGLRPEMFEAVEGLFRLYTPMERGAGIIHADICGNLLFHPDLPPCVIDFSPAYGSPGYADAILAADAIAWEGAPLDLTARLPSGGETRQLLLRAVNFRIVTAALFAPQDVRYFMSECAAFQPLIARLV